MPRPHPPEFRKRAIELARLREKPIAQIAADLGISESCLRNWLHQADVDEGAVNVDGGPIDGRAACIRTLVLPLSIVALLLGCLGILTNPERRGWHDRAAGTVVVYSWDARAAHLRWLADRASAQAA